MLSFLFIVSVDCFLLLLGFGVGKYRNGAAAITAVVVVVVVAAVASSYGGGYVFLMCFFIIRTPQRFGERGSVFFWGGFCCSCRLQRAHVS